MDWVEDVDTRVDVVNTALDDLRGLWRVHRLKRSGEARVTLPPRPAPAAQHPEAVLSPTSAKDRLTWEAACFIAIGAASTIGQAVFYWLLRMWWPPAVATFVSLALLTVLNTEASRRLTFRGSETPPGRAHLGAGVLFGVAYLVTSGAVLLFRQMDPNASVAAETAVLVAASVLVTVVRFVVLRSVVFRRPAAR